MSNSKDSITLLTVLVRAGRIVLGAGAIALGIAGIAAILYGLGLGLGIVFPLAAADHLLEGGHYPDNAGTVCLAGLLVVICLGMAAAFGLALYWFVTLILWSVLLNLLNWLDTLGGRVLSLVVPSGK